MKLSPLAFLSACLLTASFALQAKPDLPRTNFEIVTLSNRADLISDGNALVEVRVPNTVPLHHVTIWLNGNDMEKVAKETEKLKK